jgi:hypothetical protein
MEVDTLRSWKQQIVIRATRWKLPPVAASPPGANLPHLAGTASRPERSHLAPGAKPRRLAGAASPAGRPTSPASRSLKEGERGNNRKPTGEEEMEGRGNKGGKKKRKGKKKIVEKGK